MIMKKIFVFNGIHGSGKTTLIKQLMTLYPNKFIFYPEIGRQVRKEVSYNSLESGEGFDREVMRRELKRDALLLTDPRIPLVETWHIGNIGYSAARSPRLIKKYESTLKKQLELFNPSIIFVDISWKIFKTRISEKIRNDQVKDLIKFYKIITAKTHELYRTHKIDFSVIKNEGSLSKNIIALKKLLNSLSLNLE